MDLPNDLKLPLASGAPWWYWLGGRCAIDFVNTQRERWWRNVETLVTPVDLALWVTHANLLKDPPQITLTQLRAARRLRTAIDGGIQAAIDHHPPPATAIVEINRWLAHAPLPPRLERTPNGIHILGERPPLGPVQHALARIALDAATLLGTDQRDRLRICASETCSARFYDASRAATRRWCSMDGCGNTAKARRHRARHAPQPPPTRPDPTSSQRNPAPAGRFTFDASRRPFAAERAT